jgi:hypothetical protein
MMMTMIMATVTAVLPSRHGGALFLQSCHGGALFLQSCHCTSESLSLQNEV